MKIAILDLCGHPLPLLEGLPRVGEQIISWLFPALPEATYRWYDVEQNSEPLPELGTFDGLLLSGSEHGVYDITPWNRPVRELLIACKDVGKPIFGICFGHQMIADTFGGRAEKAVIGEVIGAREFDFLTHFAYAHVWHKDQVTILPPAAQVTARANYCPVGALQYEFPAASVQFHPEYSEHQLCEIFTRARDILVSGKRADEAVESFAASNVRGDLMSKETATFFRKYLT